MTRDKVKHAIIDTIHNVRMGSRCNIAEESHICTTLRVSPKNLCTMCLELEDVFDVPILGVDTIEFMKSATVGEFVDYVTQI